MPSRVMSKADLEPVRPTAALTCKAVRVQLDDLPDGAVINRGGIKGKNGDYLVVLPTGHELLLAPKDFRRYFQPEAAEVDLEFADDEEQ